MDGKYVEKGTSKNKNKKLKKKPNPAIMKARGSHKMLVRDFKYQTDKAKHVIKHASDYGGEIPYIKRALELIESPCGGTIEGYVRSPYEGNAIVRYDRATNDIAIGIPGPNGGIITLFKCDHEYFLEKREEDLKHGGIG